MISSAHEAQNVLQVKRTETIIKQEEGYIQVFYIEISEDVFSFVIFCSVNMLFEINTCECKWDLSFHPFRMGFKQYEPITSIEKGECKVEKHFCLSEVMFLQALEILLQSYVRMFPCFFIVWCWEFVSQGRRIKTNNSKQSIARILCLSLFLPIIDPNFI